MKLRLIALSIAAASAMAAAATSYAQSTYTVTRPDGTTTTYVAPPATVITNPDGGATVVAPGSTVVSPGYTYNAQEGVVNGYIVTEPGGMNPQERAAATPDSTDRATGQITAPGYMGPRDSKGQ